MQDGQGSCLGGDRPRFGDFPPLSQESEPEGSLVLVSMLLALFFGVAIGIGLGWLMWAR